MPVPSATSSHDQQRNSNEEERNNDDDYATGDEEPMTLAPELINGELLRWLACVLPGAIDIEDSFGMMLGHIEYVDGTTIGEEEPFGTLFETKNLPRDATEIIFEHLGFKFYTTRDFKSRVRCIPTSSPTKTPAKTPAKTFAETPAK